MPEVSPHLDLVVATIRASDLVPEASRGVAMLSGGPDSTAMLIGLVRVLGPDAVVAIHINYGLRSDSDDDQTACESICRELGVDLVIAAPPEPYGDDDGNLHDWARGIRYEAADSLRAERDLDWIAVGHTSTDLAETVLYRLASSPGTRAMAAMPARRGYIVRPLLAIDRLTARAASVESGVGFTDDSSNVDLSFARARIRGEVLPVLEEINSGAIENIVRTRREVEEESDLADSIAVPLLSRDPAGLAFIPAEALAGVHPAAARHAIRMLVGAAGLREAPVSIPKTAEIRRLCARPEGGVVELGGNAAIAIESGVVTARIPGGPTEVPGLATLDLPGEVEWGGWRFAAEKVPGPIAPRGPEVATLDSTALPDRVEVRAWTEGDRIRQLGMEGSKPVADLFAERGIRRSERASHPVLIAGEEIVWVPGVAVADRLRIGPDTTEVVLLVADRTNSMGAP